MGSMTGIKKVFFYTIF